MRSLLIIIKPSVKKKSSLTLGWKSVVKKAIWITCGSILGSIANDWLIQTDIYDDMLFALKSCLLFEIETAKLIQIYSFKLASFEKSISELCLELDHSSPNPSTSKHFKMKWNDTTHIGLCCFKLCNHVCFAKIRNKDLNKCRFLCNLDLESV